MAIPVEQWEHFPPTEEDGSRISRYEELREVVRETPAPLGWDTAISWVAVNFSALVCSLASDLLFGEAPEFRGSDSLPDILEDNKMDALLQEMGYSGAFRGDTVLKVRYDERPIIESVNPSLFFPEFEGDGSREMSRATLAWVKQVSQRNRPDYRHRYLRKEIHEPGLIRNELFRMEGNQIGNRVDLSTLPEYARVPEIEETGHDGLLVTHIPNWRIDTEFWGISDIWDLRALQRELSNRVSRIGDILDKHSSPKLLLPPGVMEFDERTQRYYVRKETLEALEVDPEMDTNLPRYLTWDARLESAFAQVDKLLELMMMVSETSPAALGMEKNGVSESGRALKYRLLRTLAKMNRKKRYFDAGLKEALYAAQVLEHVHGKGLKPEDVEIDWQDGLPNDDIETMEVVSAGRASGVMSLRRAIRYQGVEDVDEELKEIREDERTTEPEYNRPPEAL